MPNGGNAGGRKPGVKLSIGALGSEHAKTGRSVTVEPIGQQGFRLLPDDLASGLLGGNNPGQQLALFRRRARDVGVGQGFEKGRKTGRPVRVRISASRRSSSGGNPECGTGRTRMGIMNSASSSSFPITSPRASFLNPRLPDIGGEQHDLLDGVVSKFNLDFIPEVLPSTEGAHVRPRLCSRP